MFLAQIPPHIPPQDVIPPLQQPSPVPEQPETPPAPEEVLPDPTMPIPPEILLDSKETITVTEFEFVDNTIFSSEQLAKEITDKYLNQTLSLQQLLNIAAEVAQFYAAAGYSTSGAVISLPEVTRQEGKGVVRIIVIESKLEAINLVPVGKQRLNPNYVRSRLEVEPGDILNVSKLQEQLQLLQLNPLITRVAAQLSEGSQPGLNQLELQVVEAPSFNLPLSINNGRSPSVGSFQRQVTAREGNLLGLGDALSVGYGNSDGSNVWSFGYTLPVNSGNGTLGFNYSYTTSDVIEPPFEAVNIESESQNHELTFRQPVVQSIRQQTFQELALGVTASWRDSQTFLFGFPFPLSPGADDDGKTNVFALRLFQEWTQQDARQVLAFRSEFSFGLDAFNSTVNETPAGSEVVPDSRFFSWRGQGQWIRLLGEDTLFLVRGNLQMANKTLLSAEEFALGGFGSVRGYRQNVLSTDNGFFASAELQLPILKVPEEGVLQIIPFLDYGVGWNSSDVANPDPQTLIGTGLGLQWQDRAGIFSARFDWGIPLVDVDNRERTWQENGLYFSVQWRGF
ncbi:MAG: ShlB/FhaC/HecB family hemolysin secretion/activation protein [Spirulinaceae cyanobacterium]